MKTIYLVVTEGCNLSCKYCYRQNNNSYMSREIFLEYYENLPASPFKIFFFGGEPLLNWELIEFVVTHLQDDERCQGFEIISNGLLLDQEKADFIKKWNIDFMWSYDGLSDERIGAARDKYPIKLITDIVTEINTMVTPNNLKILDNHFFLKQFGGIYPSFRILRDNVWTQENVEEFSQEFTKYIQHLKEHPTEMPKNIYREVDALYTGIYKNVMRPDCKMFGSTTTLMPNGENPLCYKLYASEEEDAYNPDLYMKCHECEIRLFCEKGCYEQVLKNGEPVQEICTLYKIMFNKVIELDGYLVRTGNEKWAKHIRRLVDGLEI
jgi:sulfatase maturation enzyme AslB (radical SAM superfamily)